MLRLYEIAKLNKKKEFDKALNRNKRELKRCIKDNIKKGNTKFVFDDLSTDGIEAEKEIYNSLMNGLLKKPKYEDIYSCLDWHGCENSHLRLALEVMKVDVI